MKRSQTDEQIEWFGEHGYKIHQGQLWLKCPKANGVEMAWRLESEIDKDTEVLIEIREHLRQQEEMRVKEEEEEEEQREEEERKEKKKVLSFKGCKTWKEYRALCYRTAQKATPNSDDVVPCYGCPCCSWTSGKQAWGAAEFSLSVHNETKSENESPYLLSQDKRDRLKVVHPGKEWIAQTSTTGPGFEKHERQLEEAGMGMSSGSDRPLRPHVPKEEPPPSVANKKKWVPIKKEQPDGSWGGWEAQPGWEQEYPIWVDPNPVKKTHGVGTFEEWLASEEKEKPDTGGDGSGSDEQEREGSVAGSSSFLGRTASEKKEWGAWGGAWGPGDSKKGAWQGRKSGRWS